MPEPAAALDSAVKIAAFHLADIRRGSGKLILAHNYPSLLWLFIVVEEKIQVQNVITTTGGIWPQASLSFET